jgi:hypothetical protein
VPSASPRSTSACRTHLRRVSVVIPNRAATALVGVLRGCNSLSGMM